MVIRLPNEERRSARQILRDNRITPDVTPLEVDADKFTLNPKLTGQELPKQASTPPSPVLSEGQATVSNTSVAKPTEEAPFYPESTVKNSTSLQKKDEVATPDWARTLPTKPTTKTALEEAEEIIKSIRLGKLEKTTSRAEKMAEEEKKRISKGGYF